MKPSLLVTELLTCSPKLFAKSFSVRVKPRDRKREGKATSLPEIEESRSSISFTFSSTGTSNGSSSTLPCQAALAPPLWSTRTGSRTIAEDARAILTAVSTALVMPLSVRSLVAEKPSAPERRTLMPTPLDRKYPVASTWPFLTSKDSDDLCSNLTSA